MFKGNGTYKYAMPHGDEVMEAMVIEQQHIRW